MGTENEKRVPGTNDGIKGSTNTENTGTVGSTDRNSSSKNTGTGNTGTGNGTPGNTGTGNTGSTEKKQVPPSNGLATLTTETAPIPEAPKKKTRRKKTTTKKKTETPAFDSTQITALLVSLSAVVASRPNLHMFALSEMEAEQIATPLANMFAKSEKLSAVSEHADAIALVTSCLIIMLPRVIMYFDVIKQNKLKSNGGVKIADNRDNKKAESTRDNRKVAPASPAVDSLNVNGISSAIPSIV